MNLSAIIAARHRAVAGFSTEAQNYFDRLDTAGDTTYTPYKQPLANYIDGLVALGGAYWDTMVSACSFVGVGIEGIVVPLRSGMTVPSNILFLTADLSQTTGLKGDGSTTYIDTNVLENAVPQNDISMSVYVTEAFSTYGLSISGTAGNDRTGLMIRPGSGGIVWNRSPTSSGFTPAAQPEFYGTNRDNASDYDLQNGSTLTTNTLTSGSVYTLVPVCVFAAANGVGKTPNRLATYHYGPALNMATLRSLQATLMSEIAAI